jgi:hypothetical protein
MGSERPGFDALHLDDDRRPASAHHRWAGSWIDLGKERWRFFRWIQELRPQALDDLAGEPLSLVRTLPTELFTCVMDSLLPIAGSPDSKPEPKKPLPLRPEKRILGSVDRWSKAWGLNRRWCKARALTILLEWADDPEAAAERSFCAYYEDTSPRFELRPDLRMFDDPLNLPDKDGTVPYWWEGSGECRWSIQEGETRSAARARLVGIAGRVFDSYLDDVERWAREHQWRPVRRTLHLSWLVRYQLGPTDLHEDFRAIARTEGVSHPAVMSGVRSTANAIDLPLRGPSKGGVRQRFRANR